VLVGGVPRSIRVRGLVHPLFGVAQDLLGRTAAVDVIALPGFLGKGHSTTSHTIFRYLGCHTRGYPCRPIGNRVAPRSPDTGIHPGIERGADRANYPYAEEFSLAKQHPDQRKRPMMMITTTTTEVRAPRATTDSTPTSRCRSAEPKERRDYARRGTTTAVASRPTLALQRRLIAGLVG
jgi:hypothetical protein